MQREYDPGTLLAGVCFEWGAGEEGRGKEVEGVLTT